MKKLLMFTFFSCTPMLAEEFPKKINISPTAQTLLLLRMKDNTYICAENFANQKNNFCDLCKEFAHDLQTASPISSNPKLIPAIEYAEKLLDELSNDKYLKKNIMRLSR